MSGGFSLAVGQMERDKPAGGAVRKQRFPLAGLSVAIGSDSAGKSAGNVTERFPILMSSDRSP